MSLRRSARLLEKSGVPPSSRSRQSKYSDVLQVELEAARALAIVKAKAAKIVEEAEIDVINKQLQYEIAKINEHNTISEFESEKKSKASETHEVLIEERSKVNVQEWVNRIDPEEEYGEVNRTVPTFTRATPKNGYLEKMLIRQSIKTELPTFSGEPIEWINFITQLKETTDVCGFSKRENINRLQKCLRGKARETVCALLNLPDSYDKIVSLLERRFGRPELVVEELISKTKRILPIKEEKLYSIIDFSNAVQNLVVTMMSMNCQSHLSNPQLLQDLLSKLPISFLLQWGDRVREKKKGTLSLEEFATWLEEKADAVSFISCPQLTRESKFERPKFYGNSTKKETVLATTHKKSEKVVQKCQLCGEQHGLSECPTFKGFEIDNRWIWVKTNKVCFSCLMTGHPIRFCRNKKQCGVGNPDVCKKNHHFLLHPVPYNNTEELKENEPCLSHITVKRHKNILLRIVAVVLKGSTGNLHTYALFDEASTVTLVDSSVAKQIGATGPTEQLCMRWTNSMTCQEINSQVVNIEIKSEEGEEYYQMKNVRTVENLSLPVQSVNVKRMKENWKYLNTLKSSSMVNAKPTILIGQDNIHLIIAREVMEGPRWGPIASRTKLGWVLHGNAAQFKGRIDEEFALHVEEIDRDELHELVKASFEAESFGIRKVDRLLSKDDKRAQQSMDNTTKKISGSDRWETGLLWKKDHILLPESKSMAHRRLLSIEKKMDRDPVFSKAYSTIIEDFLKKGYAKKLEEQEAAINTNKTWYLPHFGVVNPNKPGKIRFVFDAAAKSHGVSLNDALLIGPDKLNPLSTVLWKFRQRKVAFAGDIKEMFPQIKIVLEDQTAQRFLWRGSNRNTNPTTYQMTSMIFGAKCSPCSAQEVKNRNAEEFREIKPLAVDAIIKRHYMDDYLDSVDTEEEAIQLIEDVTAIHRKGGFVMCNWISNSKRVLLKIPDEARAGLNKDMCLQAGNDLPTERVLGLHWDTNTDEVIFKINLNKIHPGIVDNKKIPTKREVLQIVMSIFDPIGFVMHFTIHGRILLQDIWRKGIDWDDPLTTDLYDKWKFWFGQLSKIEKIRIPRFYNFNLCIATKLQLHIFCDASEKAFTAVAFFRAEEREKITISFVAAKTRVASLKPMSIPRLELQAALLGSRLALTVRKEHEVTLNRVTFWSDSMTVLCWLKSDARKFKQFVANRVGEIEETTNVNDWRWVPSKENAADDGTKWSNQVDFLDSTSRWFAGPEFLKEPERDWPVEITKLIEQNLPLEELRPEFIATSVKIESCANLPNIERFSKWTRLIRTTAWVFRFMERCKPTNKSKICTNSRELSSAEMENAEKVWIKKSQWNCFPLEMKSLTDKKPINNCSRLFKLSPMLDVDGILRIRGRIERAIAVDNWVKQPAILDAKHRYTYLLMQRAHENNLHQGLETVVNELRQRFWILKMRNSIRRIFKACQTCKVNKACPIFPEMGQIPLCRVTPYVRPFMHTGMDYFGPMDVTVGRRHEKRYGVLFTCLTTRAVHLEIAASLSTDSCIMAIRRMAGRRGEPKEMYSDNGTNLRGAEKVLKIHLEKLNQESLMEYMSPRGITWNFNPPSAPHMGGCWERLVKSVKVAIQAILKSRSPKEEVLQTLFVEAENIVNSRPLTHVSIDSTDKESLTPNHFLIGTSSALQIPCLVEKEDLNLRKQWKVAQTLIEMFWKRWIKEYLPTLTRRTKWIIKKEQIKIGDLVFIIDGNLPRNTWPRGVITATYPGRDGTVRVVDVKTKLGTYRRPVVKLAVLDVDPNVET